MADTYLADLHVHSHFSRATSRACTLPEYWRAAQLKGISVLGTGDITHPGWLQALERTLRPAPNGLWQLAPDQVRQHVQTVPARCRAPVYFMLSGEVNCVYRAGHRSRRIHHLLYVSALDRARSLQDRLRPFGRLEADGRPTLKLDSRDLLDILLDTDDRAALVPAHAWTPWYSLLGSKSGFDSLEACFRDLTPQVHAIETGLSADPAMLHRAAFLRPLCFISSSDAHSPAKVGREATALRGAPSLQGIESLLRGDRTQGPAYTIEWHPALGKYYWDGHRKCDVAWAPATSARHHFTCPVCHRAITRGVLSRVLELSGGSDSNARDQPPLPPVRYTVPLTELVAKVLQRGPGTKAVQACCTQMVAHLGPELDILHHRPRAVLEAAAGTAVTAAILAARTGDLALNPGFDGRYGDFQVTP